jgi:hypothetical protein
MDNLNFVIMFGCLIIMMISFALGFKAGFWYAEEKGESNEG